MNVRRADNAKGTKSTLPKYKPPMMKDPRTTLEMVANDSAEVGCFAGMAMQISGLPGRRETFRSDWTRPELPFQIRAAGVVICKTIVEFPDSLGFGGIASLSAAFLIGVGKGDNFTCRNIGNNGVKPHPFSATLQRALQWSR
jgi:hypothetical protein